MKTFKRPLFVLITLVLILIGASSTANAQCFGIVQKPNPIVYDYSGTCKVNLRPTDFLFNLPPANPSTQYNLSITGLAFNVMNPIGIGSDTDTFPAIMPAMRACDTLLYQITRLDLFGNCTFTGQIVFRDSRVFSMALASPIMYSTNYDGIVSPADLNYVINNPPNCPVGIKKIEIKRAIESDSRFRDTILLNCTDPQSLNIVLRATNGCGVSQSVSATLILKDNFGPVFNIGSVADTVVNCPAIKDPSFYRLPTFSEPCGYSIVSRRIVQDSINNACGTGSFKIEYVAQDNSGNQTTYIRKFTVVNPNPFNPATIRWPKDTVIINPLITDPSQLPTSITGVPTWVNDGCELIATSLTEMVIRVSPTACSFKLVRKWSVANCCKMSGMGSLDAPYTKMQTIMVMDNVGPVLSNLPADMTESCDDNCIRNVLTLPRPTATDCGNSIFPNSAFTVTFSPAPMGMTQDPANPFTFRNIPNGTYKITYIIRDESNNISHHSYNLTIQDRTVPYLAVYDRLAVPVGTTGTVMVPISAFIDRVSDNCTAVADLTFSFSPTKDSSFVTYGCRDIRSCAGDYQRVTIYVKDKAGNVQFVTAQVDVQKGTSNCTCSRSVAGAIETPKGAKVEDVVVTLRQNNNTSSTRTTSNGYYEFKADNKTNFTLMPDKNDDVLNGVSTLDLVLISKHVLGTQKFTSPYQHIAADIDKSGKISSADIVLLRKTLLGISPGFGSNTSWRFVDKSYQFDDPQNPDLTKIPEGKIGAATSNNDFLGVKVGDLNGNAKANRLATPAGQRGTLSEMVFEAKDVSFLNKQDFKVPVCVKDFGDIIAYQFTMKFDPTKLQLIGIMNANNGADVEFGTTHADQGMATTSWMNVSSLPMDKGEMVFTLHFKAIAKGELSKCLQFSSDLTKAEAYNEDGEIAGISLKFNNVRKENIGTKVNMNGYLQNVPNPFAERTMVQFDLEESSDATITVFDQSGRILKKIEGYFNKGLNYVELSDLPAGLMLYRLETPYGFSETKRMFKLN